LIPIGELERIVEPINRKSTQLVFEFCESYRVARQTIQTQEGFTLRIARKPSGSDRKNFPPSSKALNKIAKGWPYCRN